MLKRRFLQFALMAGLSMAFVMPAKAAMTPTYMDTIPTVVLGKNPVTGTVSLQKFDSTLGTIQSAVISIVANGSAIVRVINSSTTDTESFTTATASIPISISGPVTFGVTATAGPFSGTVAPSTTKLNPGPVTTLGSSSQTYLTGLAGFVGVGTVPLSFSFSQGPATYSGSGDVDLSYGGSSTVGGTVSIYYTYIPATVIPEPSTIAALASGLVCLGLVRLRRKSA